MINQNHHIMIKVVWFTQYNVFKLLPEIKLKREVILHNSSWIHTLSEELILQNEIELHIITHCPFVEQTQTIIKNGINFHVIKYSFPFTYRGFPWYLPFDKLTGYYFFSKIACKIIDEIQPHILHVHGTEGGYFASAFKIKIPCIISIQGIISEIAKIEPTISGYSQIPFEQYAIRNAKYFGCRTNFDWQYVMSKNKNAIIFDLPEAINKVFFEKHWKPRSGISLLFVGSILHRKGIEDLIHALYKLKNIYPSIHLKIIGSGTKKYISYLNKIIEQYNLSKYVTWLGNKSPTEIAFQLTQCNFFILPSLIENSPNCLTEAMAVGVPCIATNVGGIPSMIDDKIDGMLFEKHDIDGLVNILRFLANDIELQNKLSMNARAKAFQRNYPPNIAKKYVEVYKRIIHELT